MMEATLLSAGIVCLVTAVVGGGLEALGFRIEALRSTKRQAMLAVLGALFLAAIPAGRWWNVPDSTLPERDSTNQAATHANPGADDGVVHGNSAATNLDPVVSEAMTMGDTALIEATSEAQTLLRRMGEFPGPADGLPGPRTRALISQFQREHDLPDSGLPTAATLRAMRAAAAHQDSGNSA